MESVRHAPRGDVKAALNFYADLDDGLKPYHIFSSLNNESIRFNYSDFQKEVDIQGIRGCGSKFSLDYIAF